MSEDPVQIARILIMVYRQGWIDATAHLSAECHRQATRIKGEYDSLSDAVKDIVNND